MLKTVIKIEEAITANPVLGSIAKKIICKAITVTEPITITPTPFDKILEKLQNGEIDILIGTHAILEENVVCIYRFFFVSQILEEATKIRT